MSTGVFYVRNGFSGTPKGRSSSWKRSQEQKRIVAERLSDGATIAQIAAEMEVSEGRVYQIFGAIRRDLGWQAV